MSKQRRRPKPPAPQPREAPDPLILDARFVATRELFERARERVSVADVERYAPNDPGYPEYVAAFSAIVGRGEALSREFAVTETISLTRYADAGSELEPQRFRWFRILTCAVDLLLEQSEWPHYSLAALLVDSFALADANDHAAPLDLLSGACRELDAHPFASILTGPLAFCLLGQLLLAGVDRLDFAAIEGLCVALELRDRRCHEWREFEDGHWLDEPDSHEFLWSLTAFDQLHPVWLDLVSERFPVAPPAALAMRRRLLSDGSRWMRLRRVLR